MKKASSERSFRGYVAVDDIQFKTMEETEETCKGENLIFESNDNLLLVFRTLYF